jgi:16S rRNA (guanine527-N7)-methyltransferase
VQYEEELQRVLPHVLPQRDRLVRKAAEHLRLIDSANQHMNLTRITSPREAAIKHVFDSVAPWEVFCGANRVLDAGTGAGFPGVPLSIVLPEVKFTLAESTQKKARFVDSAVEALDLANVQVIAERAEEFAASRSPEVITARAVAPTSKLLELFGVAVRKGASLLLYKGPDIDGDMEEARKHKLDAEVICRYELPDALGSRSVVRVRAAAKAQAR